MLKFTEVYGLEENGNIEEINREVILKLEVESLEYNLKKINEIIEKYFPNLKTSEKYKMKCQLAQAISTLSQSFSNKECVVFYNVLDFSLITQEDIRTGMKVTGPNGESMIDWDLMKTEEQVKVK